MEDGHVLYEDDHGHNEGKDGPAMRRPTPSDACASTPSVDDLSHHSA